mmetsp:Transcript_12878/g.32988  ORF Transcript_12878/g.32988 Transcript_12878/m.32988 type:complete len:237 (+) Transcript_12878:791-1501(+)
MGAAGGSKSWCWSGAPTVICSKRSTTGCAALRLRHTWFKWWTAWHTCCQPALSMATSNPKTYCCVGTLPSCAISGSPAAWARCGLAWLAAQHRTCRQSSLTSEKASGTPSIPHSMCGRSASHCTPFCSRICRGARRPSTIPRTSHSFSTQRSTQAHRGLSSHAISAAASSRCSVGVTAVHISPRLPRPSVGHGQTLTAPNWTTVPSGRWTRTAATRVSPETTWTDDNAIPPSRSLF